VKKPQSLITIVLAITLGGWVSTSFFRYITHHSAPVVALEGLKEGSSYRGTIGCTIVGNNSYKIAGVGVYLDGVELEFEGARSIGEPKFRRTFPLDTRLLADGEHILELEAVDSSYNRNTTRKKYCFTVDNIALKASFIQKSYAVDQGRTIHVQFQTNKPLARAQVKFLADTYECFPESEHSSVYECFVPTDCEDQPNEYLLKAILQDGVGNTETLVTKAHIKQFEFKKARGFQVAKGKLDEERDISSRGLEKTLEELAHNSVQEKLWTGNFIAPTEIQRLSTPFGEIRTTAEKGRYHHAAVDIANYPKSVVWATQRGKVILKKRFLFSGNTVALDHGCGVMSLYFHLEDFAEIEVGQILAKGNPVGRLGKTGYANGYHLHWEMRINNKKVDPMQWTQETF